jgi:transposase
MAEKNKSGLHRAYKFALGHNPQAQWDQLLRKGASVMTIESIIRRRAFRDGFYDGRQGCPMRRLATRKARWLYALGRIFANVAPTNVQVYEQRHATEAAVAAFSAMPVRYMAR